MSLLAAKLSRAVEWSTAQTGREWSPRTLAREVDNGPSGVSVSHTYIRNLLSGAQENPSLAAINAIAHALGVPTAYFLPDAPDDLDAAVWAGSEEAQYALLMLRGLSSEAREHLMVIAQYYRETEGLPEPVSPPHREAGPPPPQGATGPRRWLGGRKREDVPADEIVRRMVRDLRGPSPGDEEESDT